MKQNATSLRIAYFCVNDPLDKRSWSGITYYLGQSLQRKVGEVDFLGPVVFPWYIDKAVRAIAKFTRLVFKKEYAAKHSLLLSWYAAKALKKKMNGKQYDVLVAPAASTELAYFRTTLPIIYVSDTTFALISHYYLKDFQHIDALSRWEGNHLEQRSLSKSALVIFSSKWAARSAINDYDIPERKISVMPLGANIDFVPDRKMIFHKEENKTLTLLYLAVEWERKGGPIAYETLQYLYDAGIAVKLIVCGCVPPDSYQHPGLEVIPFLNKNVPADHQRFVHLLSTAHFLLLPTRADCSLLVACEANAYGVPAITTHTGGVPDVVLDGINGYCLPYEANGTSYAQLIMELYGDKQRYHQLVATSRQRYEDHLNWDIWAEQFLQLYQQYIAAPIAVQNSLATIS